ncbi:MAG: O-antigen ligase family protein, partial [Bacteroidales bacterium]|nr:O-antigen ligase family protein [Bacteroidales bacterium]
MLRQISRTNILTKTNEYLTYWMFFVLPFPDDLLPVSIVLWAVSWLLWRIFDKQGMAIMPRQIQIVVLVFVLYVVFSFGSAFFIDDSSLGGRIIERRLAFLLMPLVLLFGYNSNIDKQKVVRVLMLGTLLSILLLMVIGVYRYCSDIAFRYDLASKGLPLVLDNYKHQGYFTLIAIVSFYLYTDSFHNSGRRTWVHLSMMYLILGTFVYLTGSRTGALNFILMSCLLLGRHGLRHWGLKKVLMLIIPLLLIASLGILSNERFSVLFETNEKVAVENIPRRVVWESALELIAERPILGYGIGGEKKHLVSRSKVNGLLNAEGFNYNAHNQFFQFLLENGVIGFLLFISVVVLLFIFSKLSNRLSTVAISMFFTMSFMTESMLLRVAGVSIFVFSLYYLILINVLPEDRKCEVKISNRNFAIQLFTLFFVILFFLLARVSQNLSYDPLYPITYIDNSEKIVEKNALPLPLPFDLDGLKSFSAAKFDKDSKESLWSGDAY